MHFCMRRAMVAVGGAGEGVVLTAGAAAVHGQGLKHHLVEE